MDKLYGPADEKQGVWVLFLSFGQMKKIKTILLLLAVCCTLIVTQSCKDDCDDIVCENGGVCVDGDCDCPTGYSGTNCEIEDPCLNVNCGNKGVCVDGTCECDEGYTGTNCGLFDDAKVQFLIDEGVTVAELLYDGVYRDSLYGKLYKGGLIFYIERGTSISTSVEFLIASPEDLGTSEWGCDFNIMELADVIGPVPPLSEDTAVGARIGDGASNTDKILAECMADGAAKLCRAVGPEWYLPSRVELSVMINNLHSSGYGGVSETIPYWSSTERNEYYAWAYDIFSQNSWDRDKTIDEIKVRAARTLVEEY